MTNNRAALETATTGFGTGFDGQVGDVNKRSSHTTERKERESDVILKRTPVDTKQKCSQTTNSPTLSSILNLRQFWRERQGRVKLQSGTQAFKGCKPVTPTDKSLEKTLTGSFADRGRRCVYKSQRCKPFKSDFHVQSAQCCVCALKASTTFLCCKHSPLPVAPLKRFCMKKVKGKLTGELTAKLTKTG